MPSTTPQEINDCWDYIRYESDVSKELDTDFNYPKIHPMSHSVDQIDSHTALKQYSAK